eukprot:2843818-Rhodomonas_salina.1
MLLLHYLCTSVVVCEGGGRRGVDLEVLGLGALHQRLHVLDDERRQPPCPPRAQHSKPPPAQDEDEGVAEEEEEKDGG